jgi:hypothetical protein
LGYTLPKLHPVRLDSSLSVETAVAVKCISEKI